MQVLVTGGAGYIGSHTCVELLNSGYEVVIIDNFVNSNKLVVDRIKQITGKNLKLYEGDVCDKKAVFEIFEKENINAVIHFAALKAVGESVEKPIEYYSNNLNGIFTIVDACRKYNVKNIVFSSSATVYGDPATVPIKEDFPLSVTNPYGRTKLVTEEFLKDVYKADNSFNIMLLRYFNPIGAHESGLIGEDPKGIPNNLIPYISQVAIGRLECLGVFGDDYDTPDGTGVRDYVHVVDLAKGHVKAMEKMADMKGELEVYNLGTGRGYSVLEVVKAFEKACGKAIKYQIKDRRAGDIAQCYADSSKAEENLHWKAEKDIEDMCKDTWNWQTKNPNGYE
ncbi:UDP-galactose 4-epimerase [Acetitomaculum ruminis DSM 5522]|uniref:UDP-glucose 4-epimerase n=1 Tax=Acetitomaculum ruminis DSM 5522 TaxID=1120918 RepID=A0A1I0XRD2_9FIRM|nr:UDP-glucose 4-epimerase GalE [Acetitomaculum ruminis]SFB03552.1 UDP-galactose 4-epimerase [Acetitomaculum ruminis DSM 5522]